MNQYVMQLFHQRIHNKLLNEALLQRPIMEKYPSCPPIIGVNVEPVSATDAPSPPIINESWALLCFHMMNG